MTMVLETTTAADLAKRLRHAASAARDAELAASTAAAELARCAAAFGPLDAAVAAYLAPRRLDGTPLSQHLEQVADAIEAASASIVRADAQAAGALL